MLIASSNSLHGSPHPLVLGKARPNEGPWGAPNANAACSEKERDDESTILEADTALARALFLQNLPVLTSILERALEPPRILLLIP
jgi:hypothetical protein